jgi:hypothetical protein
MPRTMFLVLALLAAPAVAQSPPSPFIVDEDELDRRYGIGGEGGGQGSLPPSEGAELGGPPRAGYRYETPSDRSRPGAVGGDVVDERGVVQPGQRPFIRF